MLIEISPGDAGGSLRTFGTEGLMSCTNALPTVSCREYLSVELPCQISDCMPNLAEDRIVQAIIHFVDQGKLNPKWVDIYCLVGNKNCVRFQMEESGADHPDNMLPNGTIKKDLSY